MSERTLSSTTTSSSQSAIPGTPVIVDVFAKSTADGGVEFSHKWRWGEDGPSEGNGTIKIPKRLKKDPGTWMQFRLRDDTKPNRGFQFSKKQGAAMWVQRDTCPPHDLRCDDPEIPPEQMEVKPKLLKAHNLNGEECNLHYRLWFEDQQGYPDSYDPDITNGGKGVA